MLHSFPPVEALEFGPRPIVVLLLYGLKNHGIIGSALSGGSFLIVNLIEQGHMLVEGTPMIF
jgi:predicted transcriptional regulator